VSRWFALFAFALCAPAVAAYWWLAGRPVALADAPTDRLPCVSYTPFRGDQTPFDRTLMIPPGQIEEDLRLLAERVACVRTYAVDQGLDAVPEIAARYGLKVMLGIWIGREKAGNRRQIETAAHLANAFPDTVQSIVVGNETLLRREQTAATMAGYIAEVRRLTGVPLTYADVWEFWNKNRELADAVDFITIHILPYWEDHPIDNDLAAPYVAAKWREMQALFAGRRLMVGETGWPSLGRQRDGAVPSRVNQARFVREFTVIAVRDGIDYNLIEAFDQPWKRALEGAVGGYWGIMDGARRVKFPFKGPVEEDPAWRLHLALALALAAVPVLAAMRRRRLSASRWLVAAAGAQAAGTTLVEAALHVMATGRNLWEFVVGGASLGLTAATAWIVLDLVAGGNRWRETAAAPVRRVLGWLRRPTAADLDAGLALGLLQGLAVFAAAVHVLGLVFDARYRGFPVAHYLVPAVGFLVLWLAGPAAGDDGDRAEEAWLAAILVPGALAVPFLEGLANEQALVFSAVAVVLGLPWFVRAWRRRQGPFGWTARRSPSRKPTAESSVL
jgi:glucan 1,3-beta-glucosidase